MLRLHLYADEEEPTDLNTIVFSLVVKCERDRSARPNERDINKLYHNTHGTSDTFNLTYGADVDNLIQCTRPLSAGKPKEYKRKRLAIFPRNRYSKIFC